MSRERTAMSIRHRISKTVFFALVGVLIFVLSYAPFVRYAAVSEHDPAGFGYRTPGLYRPVEWLTLATGTRWGSPLLAWAQLCGSRGAAEIQVWFYAQGIEDPGDICVHVLPPD